MPELEYQAKGRLGLPSIVFDGHYCAGRGGLGAVMGTKRLKAIYFRGNGKKSVFDPEGLRNANTEIMRLMRASPAIFGEFKLSKFGNAALLDLVHARRLEPTNNFRETFFREASNYSGYNLKTRYKTKKNRLCRLSGALQEDGKQGRDNPGV